MPKSEKFQSLPAPWDRIFALGTRLFVWGLLITILYILRPFFLLIFLTFVFGYVQSHGVNGLEHRFKRRPYRVIIVFLVFLGTIIGMGYFLTPRIKEQVLDFQANHKKYLAQADKAIYELAEDLPMIRGLLPPAAFKEEEKPGEEEGKEGKEQDTQEPRPPIIEPLVSDLIGLGSGDAAEKKDLTKVLNTVLATGTSILGFGSAFLLSLLFSFLIVLDLPKLSRAVAGLSNTKLGFIYEEVAENIYDFGKVLGRALEAQLFIAICNTILTAIGIYLMGLENLVFLATIVFFCSFIPVAGVFISSAPICLLALQQSGIQLMLVAIGLILLIHFIEAYFLNPRIFGHHLRMNAVIVLIVLTVGGKLFGVWGLILGLPIVNYFFGHAIRYLGKEKEGAARDTGASQPRH